MNAVIYKSRSGNTAKLAEAVAGAIGVKAQPVSDNPAVNGVDTLFVGASIYAERIDKALRVFLPALDKSQVKKVVVFGTACGPKSAHGEIKALLAPKGIEVADEFFQCRGKFLFINKGRPDEADLKAAADFAKKMAGA